MAKTIEFRVTRGTSSRIFHLGNASPLVFGLEEFLIGDDGKLIAKVSFFIYINNININLLNSRTYLYPELVLMTIEKKIVLLYC